MKNRQTPDTAARWPLHPASLLWLVSMHLEPQYGGNGIKNTAASATTPEKP